MVDFRGAQDCSGQVIMYFNSSDMLRNTDNLLRTYIVENSGLIIWLPLLSIKSHFVSRIVCYSMHSCEGNRLRERTNT